MIRGLAVRENCEPLEDVVFKAFREVWDSFLESMSAASLTDEITLVIMVVGTIDFR